MGDVSEARDISVGLNQKRFMTQLLTLSLAFSIVSALSIALTGDRALLKGDFFSVSGFIALVTHWRFMLAMALALGSRFLFVWINSHAITIPSLSASATTVTALVTAGAYPAILLANSVILGERLSVTQLLGSALIMAGIVLSCYQETN